MRVNVIILTCTLSLTEPAAAQLGTPYAPPDPGSPPVYGMRGPIGSDDGLDALERSALHGDRNAVALLAVLLQDAPEMEGSLVRSALHFRVAIAAGCSDVDILAAHAVGRLSPEQRAVYERDLPHWVPATEMAPDPRLKGPCLRW